MEFRFRKRSWERRVLIPLGAGLIQSQYSFGMIEVNKDKSQVG